MLAYNEKELEEIHLLMYLFIYVVKKNLREVPAANVQLMK